MKFAEKLEAGSFLSAALASVEIEPHGHSDKFIVEDARLLFGGDFKRSGVDLVISNSATERVLHDYFKGEKRAPIASPDGAHLTGDMVNALAGHVDYAQAAGNRDPGRVIGHVSQLTGNANAIRNGVSIILNQGDNVEKGDVVQTGASSALGISFIDGTVFGLASNARMVLNEMIYDPNGSSNASLISLVQGAITFVAGETAKHGDMKIDTPTATLGIRGTAVLVEIDFQVAGQGSAPPVKFQVLAEPDGHTGSYMLFDKPTDGTVPVQIGTINQSGISYSVNGTQGVSSEPAPPLPPETAAIIQQVYALSFPNYTPPNDVNTKSTNPSGGSSTPPDNMLNPLDFSPLKNTPVDEPLSLIPIKITLPPSDTGGIPTIVTAPVLFTVLKTVNVTPVADKSHFYIADHVTIEDANPAEVVVPYVLGSATIISTVNIPANVEVTHLISIDPRSGEVNYDPANFSFLAAGSAAVITIGFESSAGFDIFRESLTLTIDRPAPPIAIAITSASSITNHAVQTITGTVHGRLAEVGTIVTLLDTVGEVTTTIGTATVGGGGVWTAEVILTGDGVHSIVAEDAAGGNSAISNPVFVTLDTTPPLVTLVTLITDSGVTNHVAQTFTGVVTDSVAEVGNTVRLLDTVGGVTTTIGTATVGSGGVFTADVALSGDGLHRIVAENIDAAGNTGNSNSVVLTLDTMAPAVAITTPGGSVNQSTQIISGTVPSSDAGTTITIFDSAIANSSITSVGAALLTAGHNLVGGLGGTTGFGTQTLTTGDDNSSAAIDIMSVFGAGGVDFFGHNYTSLYVNNNGNITFASPNGTYTPSAIDGGLNNPIIAPFWADVDTRGGNSAGANQVIYNVDATDGVLSITWDEVGYYSASTDKLNSFQVQLINLGSGNFDIVYRYENIDWTTGSASGGSDGLGGTPARAGYSAGDGTNYYELPESGSQAALLSLPATAGNTGIPGVDVFQVLNGVVESPTQTVLGHAIVQADGSWSTSVTLPDGSNSLTAQDTDAAGNVGTSAPVVLTLNAVGPTVTETLVSDTGSSAADAITSDDALSGTGLANTAVHFKIDGTLIEATVTTNAEGQWSFTPPGLADGLHTIDASQTDNFGNTGTTNFSFTLDRTAPAVAIITQTGGSNQAIHTITGSGEAGTTLVLSDDGSALPAVIVDQTGHWSDSITLSEGSNSLTAQDTDAAGNVSTSAPVVLTLNTVGPTVTETLVSDTGSSATDAISSDDALSGTGLANTAVHFKIDGTLIEATVTTNAEGQWSFTPPGLADGLHTIDASQTDNFGNTGTTNFSFTLDRTAPAVAIITQTGGSNQAIHTITGSGEAGTTLVLSDDGSALPAVIVDQTGHWSDSITLSEGSNSLTAQDTDAAGNVSTSAPVVLTLNTVGPTVTETLVSDTGSSATDAITSDDALSGTGLDNTAVHFKIDGTLIEATVTTNAEGQWSFTPPGLADGLHTIDASQTDSLGNTGTTNFSFTLDTMAPAVAITTPGGSVNQSTQIISGTVPSSDAGTTITIFDSAIANSSITSVGAALLTAGHNLVGGLGGTTGFGTQTLTTGDDNSSAAIDIMSVFGAGGVDFFGHNYTSLYVNNNGNITFASPNGTYTPSAIDGGLNNPIIAPFWADVDTRGGNSAGANQVIYNVDATDGVLSITWDEVGYYSASTDKLNSFQVQLINLGSGNFDIVYRYENIDWTTGSASGGSDGLGGTPARAGYSAGDGTNYYELPESGSQAALLSLPATAGNTGIPGVDVFQVLNGVVESPTQTVLGHAIVQADGSWSTSVTLPDGSNSLTAQDTDAAGNVGTSAPVVLTLNAGYLQPVALFDSADSNIAPRDDWLNAGGGDFTTPSNWTDGILPIPGDSVFIEAPGTYTVTSAEDEIVNSIDIGPNSTLDVTGGSFIVMSGSGSGGNDGLIKVEHAGSILSLSGTIANTGTIEAYDAATNSVPGASVELSDAQIIGGTLEALAGGKIDVVSGTNIVHAAITIDGSSNLVVENGATLVIESDFRGAGANGIINNGIIGIAGSAHIYDGGALTITNNGMIELQPGSSSVLEGAVSGTGTIKIDGGATLELASVTANDFQIVSFASNTGTLRLDSPQSFHAAIAGFSGGGELSDSDQIDLININKNSVQFHENYDASTGILNISDGTNTAQLHFDGFTESFKFVTDGNAGTIVYDPPVPTNAAAITNENEVLGQTFVHSHGFKFNFSEPLFDLNAVGQNPNSLEFPTTTKAHDVLTAAMIDGHSDHVAFELHDGVVPGWSLKTTPAIADFHLA